MKIIKVIERLKNDCGDLYFGKKITEATSRDQILYGDPNQECTGIVTTCYPSIDVIEKAGQAGFNFIVTHEAMFLNHGDHTEWLTENTAFQKKEALLKKYNICVWRNHDRIHAGILIDGKRIDGIFYGLSKMLGWNDYWTDPDTSFPQSYDIPEMSVAEMAEFLIQKFRLNGVRFIGNPDCKIKKVYVPMHILGHASDNDVIKKMNDENINCLITLEMVDFTVCEYMRDAGMLGEDRCIFALGHFNTEEIGMEFYAEYLQEHVIKTLPVRFLQSGDTYTYIPKTQR